MSNTASHEFVTTRWRGSPSAGRYGSAGLSDPEGPRGCSEATSLHERILGRPLADGTRIQITVEVLDEKPWPPTESTWHPPAGRTWDEYEAYCRWPERNSHGYGGFLAWVGAGKPGFEEIA